MVNKLEYLVYKTGIVSMLHKRRLCFLKVGIDENIRKLKQSYLNNKRCEQLKFPESELKYSYCDFEEVLNEIRKISIVGLYQMWERNLKELLVYGCWPEYKDAKVIDKFGIEKIISLFENSSECSATLKETFYYLKKYSILNNAIKHGPGKSFDKLITNYQEFFYNDDLSDEEFIINHVIEPIVKEEHINELYNNLIKFWENIPDKLEVKISLLDKLKK